MKASVQVGMLLKPINYMDKDAGSCPWYFITTEQDVDGTFVKAFNVLYNRN